MQIQYLFSIYNPRILHRERSSEHGTYYRDFAMWIIDDLKAMLGASCLYDTGREAIAYPNGGYLRLNNRNTILENQEISCLLIIRLMHFVLVLLNAVVFVIQTITINSHLVTMHSELST